jgi:hypothetical protein
MPWVGVRRWIGACLLLAIVTPTLGAFELRIEPQHAPLNDLFTVSEATFVEPWGAEDFSHEDNPVRIPEPLLFDLVRPLGARQGELEFNTLALFPWRRPRRDPDRDPFGSGPSTPDRAGIEWAPEVEYAPWDGFAIEFEFPFEDTHLESYKLGLQWTFGTAFDDHYIHGLQILVEPDIHWERWNSTFLYLGGVRFDETWSALFMAGIRLDLEGPSSRETFERLLNVTLFADVGERTTVGVETNYAARMNGSTEFIIVPQWHYEITNYIQIQAGVGFGFTEDDRESSVVLRGIWSK